MSLRFWDLETNTHTLLLPTMYKSIFVAEKNVFRKISSKWAKTGREHGPMIYTAGSSKSHDIAWRWAGQSRTQFFRAYTVYEVVGMLGESSPHPTHSKLNCLCSKSVSDLFFRKNPNRVTVAMSIKTFWLQANFTNLFTNRSSVDRNRKLCAENENSVQGGRTEVGDKLDHHRSDQHNHIIKCVTGGIFHNLRNDRGKFYWSFYCLCVFLNFQKIFFNY